MHEPLWMWILFLAIVGVLIMLDLGLFNRKPRAIGIKDSIRLSLFYVAIALLFGLWVWYSKGIVAAELYYTGYLLEKSLSLDNIFVISLIFSYFSIPRHLQHRVLFWGILGAVVLRGIVIALGAAIVSEFGWVLYLFALFLVFTGIKMILDAEEEAPDISKNKILLFLNKRLRITNDLHGMKFSVMLPSEDGSGKLVRYFTPMFVCLVLIEFADIIFAVDSIPAIFAITTDPYIVYTSNIFAILGLRALYFALSAMLHRFEYLKYSISMVLVFIGGKILLGDFILPEGHHVPEWVSLLVTVSLLTGGVIYSLYKTGRQENNNKTREE